MERSHLFRNVALFLAVGGWIFLLLAFLGFNVADWPSHAVDPNPPTHNLCGTVGAFVAYWCFYAAGQGVFPVLFFLGAFLVVLLFKSKVSDVWMRAAGLVLLATAFAATVHHIHPGDYGGFPEGQGGVIDIGVAHFLQKYFSVAGTRLILLITFLVGLLLAADDLVLRTPGMMQTAFETVRDRAPHVRWNFVSIPRLPALPGFVTRDAATGKPARGAILR